ncbi:MFS transporter [Lentzea sp. NPDC004789]
MKLGSAGLVLRHPQIRLPLLGSLIGRVPLGVATVALLLGVQAATGSTEASGIVTAAATVGVAAGAVVQGRMLDRLPRKAVLASFACVQIVALCLLAVATSAKAPLVLLAGLALLFGLSVPSLTATTRWLMRSVVTEDELPAAFTLDTVVLQFLFVIGPSAAAVVTSLFGPSPALFGCAVCILVGTGIFLRTAAPDLLVPAPKPVKSTVDAQSDHARPTLYIAVFLLAMAFVSTSSGFLSLGITELATVRQGSLEPVGIAFSAMSIGSLTGGLVFGALKWKSPLATQYVLLATGNAALLAVLTTLPAFGVFYVVIAVAGLFLSPLASLASQTLDRLAPPSAWMQTQGWGTVANTAGQTAGLAAGGIVAGLAGPVLAFACSAGAVALAAVVAMPTLMRASRKAPNGAEEPAPALVPEEKT